MVNVNVRTRTLKVPTSSLKIGIFMNGLSNQGQQNLANSAEQTAKSFGCSVVVLNFNFDQQAEINAPQDAATSTHRTCRATFSISHTDDWESFLAWPAIVLLRHPNDKGELH
jgi:hypothetical protein